MKPQAQEHDPQRWKEKYLNSLDEIEALEHELTQQIQSIAHGLIHISRLARGQDPQLDQQLDQLRKQLQHNSLDKTLRSTLTNIENSISRVRSDQLETQEQIISTIQHTLEQMHEIDLPRDIKKQLRDYRKNLQRKTENIYLLPEILSEYSRIQYNIIQTLPATNKPSTSLLKKILGPNKSTNTPPDENQLNLETCTTPATIHNNKPIPVTASTASTTNDINHDIAEHITDILHNILHKIPTPDKFINNKTTLQNRLQKSTTTTELLDILDEISEFLFIILEHEQQELRDFLDTINQRLTEVGIYLKKTRDHQQLSAQSNETLDQQIRNHIHNLQTHIHESQDLNSLKQSIRTHLDEISTTITTFCEQEQQQSHSITNQLQGLIERVQQMETESRDIWKKFEEQKQTAFSDTLTGLPNRHAYNERLDQEYNRWHRYKTPLSIAIGDIDYFKKINDTYGHLAGDKVLQATANVMQTALRETDFIARYGGEEFVIILPNTNIEAALHTIEKLRKTVEQCPFHYRKKRVGITLSFGISEFKNPTDNSENVLERADHALYNAKNNGRNRTETTG